MKKTTEAHFKTHIFHTVNWRCFNRRYSTNI